MGISGSAQATVCSHSWFPQKFPIRFRVFELVKKINMFYCSLSSSESLEPHPSTNLTISLSRVEDHLFLVKTHPLVSLAFFSKHRFFFYYWKSSYKMIQDFNYASAFTYTDFFFLTWKSTFCILLSNFSLYRSI